MQNLLLIFQWWLVFFVIGISFLPLTFIVFKNFFDKGYVFSKILGVAVVSYAVFLLGILHIIPFSFLTSALVLIFFALLNISFITRGKSGGLRKFLTILKENWLIFLFEEVLFSIALLFWSYVRSFQPDIHGLEKYMDFGFINSILRSEFFPPKDMWFTPLSINYYYFGHLTTAVLTKLSNIPSNITFNLMIATVFAFTFAGSFSIGANLIHKLNVKRYMLFAGGFLTAFIVSFAGNLQTIYAFFKNYVGENPVPFWHLPFSLSTFPNNYWYPNATRFINNTIHEFPLYSFVVSDLHGHVLDIPFVLLTIALLFSIAMKHQITNHHRHGGIPTGNYQRDKSQMVRQAHHPEQRRRINSNNKTFGFLNLSNWNLFRIWNFEFEILLLALLLAIMYMTNAWDGIIYFLLTALVLFFLSKKLLIGNWFLTIAILFFGFFIFSYPFNHFFKPFVSGIGIICPPDFLVKIGKIGPFIFEADHCQKSPWWQIMILYGFFYFWAMLFFLFILKKKKTLGFGNWGLFRNLKLEIRNLAISDIFVLLLILLSTILIIIPELIYVKDIYPAHYRANTMFKLVYQSFIMLSISSSYIIFRIMPNIFTLPARNAMHSFGRRVYFIFTILFLILVFIYPYFAIKSYYGDLKTYSGLDGTVYLKNKYPQDHEAILWINKNIKGSPVIVEAQGDSYTDYARISANTGLPTILGWTVHEWLWRGSYDIVAPRIEEVRLIYESQSLEQTRMLLEKHKVEYIYVGKLEREKYTNINESKFEEFGRVVFESRNTRIYKLN